MEHITVRAHKCQTDRPVDLVGMFSSFSSPLVDFSAVNIYQKLWSSSDSRPFNLLLANTKKRLRRFQKLPQACSCWCSPQKNNALSGNKDLSFNGKTEVMVFQMQFVRIKADLYFCIKTLLSTRNVIGLSLSEGMKVKTKIHCRRRLNWQTALWTISAEVDTCITAQVCVIKHRLVYLHMCIKCKLHSA